MERIAKEGGVDYSVRSEATVVQIFRGGSAIVLEGDSGARCLAVFVGDESERMERQVRVGRKLVFDAAVTRFVSEHLYGRIGYASRAVVRSFRGTPLLYIYHLCNAH